MEGYAVVERFSMHWGEMDALGHANNARFFVWFETARIAYFRRVGVIADRPTDAGPILATTTCDFLAPVVYPAQLSAGARVEKIGRTSFTMSYAVDAGGVRVARGSGVVVMVDYKTMQKIPIPEAIRAEITALDGL